jgi:serine protease Do
MKTTAFALLIAAGLGACQTPPAATVTVTTFDDLIARLESASVVEVSATVERVGSLGEATGSWLDPFFPRVATFPGAPEKLPFQNLGAGVVISVEGFVLTNAHVVANASEVTVGAAGEPSYPARVVGIDSSNDIALLKIEPGKLPVTPVGRSRELKSGDWVAAIGAPDGFPNSIRLGVVSGKMPALGRGLIPFVRADAVPAGPISGGPLLNRNGEVVGMSSGVVAERSGRDHTSLAVSIETVLDIAQQLRAQSDLNNSAIREDRILPYRL